jgi:tRNA(Ile2) C34 agmatinyltransferase TiaS
MGKVEAEYRVTCPHCGKAFTAAPLSDEAGRERGFKCRHCRLFVPFERAEERQLLEPAE